MSRDKQVYRTDRKSEEGFALILAMLSLLVLTFLGLTLTTTTTTELQIANNYRWGQQAYYAAEAGIEAGKIILRNIQTDWRLVLWDPARGGWLAGTTPNPPGPTATPVTATMPNKTNDQWGNASRTWENQGCDTAANVGYGLVLDDTPAGGLLLGQAPAGPYQNVNSFRGMPIPGTAPSLATTANTSPWGSFTLWVRRDVQPNGANLQDDPSQLNIVLTSEGVAPARQAVGLSASDAWRQAARAVRVLSIKLNRSGGTSNPCEKPGGQVGGAPSGANFQTCAMLQGGATGSLAAAFGTTIGDLKDKAGVR